MIHWGWLIFAAIIGGCIGAGWMALLQAGKEADERRPKR